MWETWIFNMMTGDLIERVWPQSSPWSTSLLGDGSADTVFRVDDEERPLPRAKIWSLFRPNQRGIAHLWGSHVSYAGKIESWTGDRDAGAVTVKSVELRNETAWRLTYGVNQYENGTLTISNRSHAAAAGLVFQRFMQWSADWQYPIDLPNLTTTGSFSASWPYWKKLRISDLLTQIEEEGYEVYLRPKLVGTQIRYDVVTQAKIRTGVTTFILDAAESPLLGISYTVDGAEELTGVQGLGEGTGQDQPAKWAGAPSAPGKPVRDTKMTFPDLAGDRLQEATNAAAAAGDEPVLQLSVRSFQMSDGWGAVHATPGRGWIVKAAGDPIIPDDDHVVRVIRTSGDVTSDQIETETQYGAA